MIASTILLAYTNDDIISDNSRAAFLYASPPCLDDTPHISSIIFDGAILSLTISRMRIDRASTALFMVCIGSVSTTAVVFRSGEVILCAVGYAVVRSKNKRRSEEHT